MSNGRHTPFQRRQHIKRFSYIFFIEIEDKTVVEIELPSQKSKIYAKKKRLACLW